MRKVFKLSALVLTAAFLVTSLAVGMARPTAAAPAQPKLSTPHLINKVTLNDTSLDGPAVALSTEFSAGVLAWTGTDSAHHLNLRLTQASNLGVSDLAKGSKRTLAETSISRPAVAINGGDSTPSVTVAWVGTDPKHTLNVLFDVYGEHPEKLTLWGETSFTSPALSIDPMSSMEMMLAWSGNDANHSINVLPIDVAQPHLARGTKTTLWKFHSLARPSLALGWDAVSYVYRLSWTELETHRLAYALSDGMTFTMPSSSPMSETSLKGPSLITARSEGTEYTADFIAWTGTDTNRSLNVRYTLHFPTWGNPATTKATFKESCLGGPTLNQADPQVAPIIAWTGTDPAHHLNLAQIRI
jgi:hypothetical protein